MVIPSAMSLPAPPVPGRTGLEAGPSDDVNVGGRRRQALGRLHDDEVVVGRRQGGKGGKRDLEVGGGARRATEAGEATTLLALPTEAPMA